MISQCLVGWLWRKCGYWGACAGGSKIIRVWLGRYVEKAFIERCVYVGAKSHLLFSWPD